MGLFRKITGKNGNNSICVNTPLSSTQNYDKGFKSSSQSLMISVENTKNYG